MRKHLWHNLQWNKVKKLLSSSVEMATSSTLCLTPLCFPAQRRPHWLLEPLLDLWMLTFLRVLAVQRSMMSSALGRGGMTGTSFFSSLSELEADSSGMFSGGGVWHFYQVICPYSPHMVECPMLVTFVLPLLQRWLGSSLWVPAWLRHVATFLLEVPAAVPAVGVLAEPLARPAVDALSVSDGGPETSNGHIELDLWEDSASGQKFIKYSTLCCRAKLKITKFPE